MSIVYVVQEPPQRQNAHGFWEARIDLSKAERFGKLVYLLPWSAIHKHGVADSIAQLCAQLLRFQSDDFLLMMGNPTAMAVAVLAASRQTPDLKLLYWDRGLQDYDPVIINVHELRIGEDNGKDRISTGQ
jgi:hypothetical protein